MGDVHRIPDQRREFITDGDRSALRATWHRDSGRLVISLWRADTCVATSHLTPHEAGRLASFIAGGLATLAEDVNSPKGSVTQISPRFDWRDRVRSGIRSWRIGLGSSLAKIADRLRSGA